MARPFSYANVAALSDGESCVVNDAVSTVKRKVALYAARNNKRFAVTRGVNDETGASVAIVRRLPVTDAELPSAA